MTGYPITEPYWVRVPVAGVTRDVLVQCFERGCLTYTPSNPDGWRVEMANIGGAYLSWLEQTAQLNALQTVTHDIAHLRAI